MPGATRHHHLQQLHEFMREGGPHKKRGLLPKEDTTMKRSEVKCRGQRMVASFGTAGFDVRLGGFAVKVCCEHVPQSLQSAADSLLKRDEISFNATISAGGSSQQLVLWRHL